MMMFTHLARIRVHPDFETRIFPLEAVEGIFKIFPEDET